MRHEKSESTPTNAPSTLVRRLWMAAGGLAVALAFLYYDVAWPLAWIAFVPLFALAPRAPTPRSAVIDGFVMGAVANGIVCAWLVHTIHRFGGFPLPLALFFYAALVVYTTLPFVAVASLLRWAGPSAPVLLAPALWVSAEFLFPNLFPWRLANSQRAVTWLIQIGDVTGPYALSFALTWFASALTRARRDVRVLIPPLAGVVLLAGYGWWRIHEVDQLLEQSPPIEVGVVQGNLSLVEKRAGDLLEANVERYRRLSSQLEPAPDLLVWPETVVGWAIPSDAQQLASLDPYPNAPAPLVFGAVSYEPGRPPKAWFNSAFLRRDDGDVGGRYDKAVLMPFGEFIPFASYFPWIKDLSPNTGDFTAGAGPVVLDVDPRVRVAPLVCYDDLLAGHVRAAGASGATLLLTLANDAWFGDSAALHLHESLALWRAIENRRYLVRATNTGLTSLIDPFGRRTWALPTWTEAAAKVTVRPLQMPTVYQAWGDSFAWLVVALASTLLLQSGLRKRVASAHDREE